MSTKKTCKGKHEGHLCVLITEGMFDKVKTLVNKPTVICFNCGRAANSADNVCNPMPLSAKDRKSD